MGACASIKTKRHITLLMIGLDNSGKTSTTKHLLREGNPEDVVPTVGFSSVQTERCGFHVTLCDLGGGAKIRAIWERYYALAHGLVLVVDASATHRAPECRRTVAQVLADPRISGKPLLVLLNKQDLETAVDEMEMCSLLDLENMVNQHKCPTRVENCCAIRFGGRRRKRDPGIDKGFQWLLGHIARNWEELKDRVERDTALHREQEERDKAERLARVQKARELRAKASRKDGSITEDEGDKNGNKIASFECEQAEVTAERPGEEDPPDERKMETPDGARVIVVSPVQRHPTDGDEEKPSLCEGRCEEQLSNDHCPSTPSNKMLGLSLYISEASYPPMTQIDM
ncbi:ADP-ribosylation factor-like protein 13B isoform X2 [Dermacentor andersoni]|uniref:ADP-ribosylation factor-like protein 13B isoform X2 n=1 Tax=Dermacentor andersoni TaxID=34620 RepID=UPI0021552990